MYIGIFISLFLLMLGSYIIWPSRYNISTHLALAFFPVQYMIPTLILPEIISEYDDSVVHLYGTILGIGSFFYILGMLLGYKTKHGHNNSFLWNKISESEYTNRVINVTKGISIFACVGLIFCFAVMGFVPMFTSDPFSAKFFKGVYAAPYARVAVLYRTCHFFLQFVIPILIVLWHYNKKRKYLFLAAIAVLLLAVSLTRGPAFSGILVGIGIIIATQKKQYFKQYIVLLIFVYSIGSSIFYIIGIFTGIEGFMISNEESSIYQIMSDGSPDVKDQLQLLTAFEAKAQYTYGRTFFGGLIPGNYKWNPAVWTLSVVNETTDIKDIASGGFRLPLPLWGYVAFFWPGVILLSSFVGFLTGKFVKITKRLLSEKSNPIIQAIIILLYIKVFTIFINFHLLSMYSVPILAIMALYIYNINISFGRRKII